MERKTPSTHPGLRKHTLSGCLIAEPLVIHEFFAVHIVISHTAGPAGLGMDTGTADAGIRAEVLKFTTEPENQRVGEPDGADTVFSQA